MRMLLYSKVVDPPLSPCPLTNLRQSPSIAGTESGRRGLATQRIYNSKLCVVCHWTLGRSRDCSMESNMGVG